MGGPAGTVLCETCALGMKWHHLPFDGQVAVDVRVICPHGVKICFRSKSEGPIGRNGQQNMSLRSRRKECGWSKTKLRCEEDHRDMDRQAPQCDEEAGGGRRLGADKIVRCWLVRREEVSRM